MPKLGLKSVDPAMISTIPEEVNGCNGIITLVYSIYMESSNQQLSAT